MTKYETTYLLELSRYPEHFYPLVMGLTGKDILYKNPGTSLRSHVLAGTNPLQEFISVSDEMVAIIEECKSFTSDVKIIYQVHDAMLKFPYELIDKIGVLAKNELVTAKLLKTLRMYITNLSNTWNVLNRTSEPVNCVNNLFTPEGKEYKQALFDTRFYTGELISILDNLQNKNLES